MIGQARLARINAWSDVLKMDFSSNQFEWRPHASFNPETETMFLTRQDMIGSALYLKEQELPVYAELRGFSNAAQHVYANVPPVGQTPQERAAILHGFWMDCARLLDIAQARIGIVSRRGSHKGGYDFCFFPEDCDQTLADTLPALLL